MKWPRFNQERFIFWVAIILIILHAIFPNVKIDNVTVFLLIIAILAPFIPGFISWLPEIKKATAKFGSAEIGIEKFEKKVDAASSEIQQIASQATIKVGQERRREKEFALEETVKSGVTAPELYSVIPTTIVEEEIWERAKLDIKMALVMLAVEFEKRLRVIAESNRIDTANKSIIQILALLKKRQITGDYVSESLYLFWQIRNKVVHGERINEDDVIRAIDSGISLYNSLETLPTPSSFKLISLVPCFRDPACTIVYEDIKAVIIDAYEAGNARRVVVPTSNEYKVSQYVTWAWNMQKRYDEAWYQDPFDNMKIKYAWTELPEFIGKLIED